MMKKMLGSAAMVAVALVTGLLLTATGIAKEPQKPPLKLVMSPRSTVDAADVLKNLREKCPNVTITLDSKSSDYMLEAGGWPGHYRFTVFKHGGDAVFATTTVALSNAVKDVCKYVNNPK